MNMIAADIGQLAIPLSVPLSVLLPQPIDRVCRALRPLCAAAPLPELSAALDALVEQIDECDPSGRLLSAALPILRERDPCAFSPSDHLAALECYYEPDEDDAPIGPDENDREWRAFAAALDQADATAEREWRADMARMLDAVRQAVLSIDCSSGDPA